MIVTGTSGRRVMLQICFDKLVAGPRKGPMSKKQALALIEELKLSELKNPSAEAPHPVGEGVSVIPANRWCFKERPIAPLNVYVWKF